MILASWTPPPYGQVRLVRSDQPPPWPAGTRLRPADSAGLREIPGVPRRGPTAVTFSNYTCRPGITTSWP